MTIGSFDVVIVGNGSIGLSTAIALADEQPDSSIAVVGPSARIYGATPAAGAMLGCFGEITAAGVASPYGRRKFELAKTARGYWPAWFERLGVAPDDVLTTRETVVLLNSVGYSEVDSGNFFAIERELRDADEPFSEIDVNDIKWIDPDSNFRPLRALHLPNEGAVDSGALLNALTAAAERRGITFVDETATALRSENGRIQGVDVAGGAIAGGTVVVAAGAASDPLIQSVPELTYRVPMVVAGGGVSVLAQVGDQSVPPYVLRTPNRAFACGLHVVPRKNGTVYIGATNDVYFEPQTDWELSDLIFLTDGAIRQVRRDLNHAKIQQITLGNRPMSIDGWPLIGPTSVENLWILTGTYRDGLHQSPMLATDLARRISGREGMVDLSEFRPEREPINPVDKSVVVDDVVRHTLACGHEDPWRVDPDWPGFIANVSRTAYSVLIDRLGSDYIAPPEVLHSLLMAGDTEISRIQDYYKAVYAAWH